MARMHHHLATDDEGTRVGRGELRALRAWCGKKNGAKADSSGARRQRNAREKKAAAPPHAGRPPGPEHDRRKTYTVRLSAHEWTMLCRLARKVGTPARVLMRCRIIEGGGVLA